MGHCMYVYIYIYISIHTLNHGHDTLVSQILRYLLYCPYYLKKILIYFATLPASDLVFSREDQQFVFGAS